MIEFTRDEAGEKAYKEYYEKIMILYEQYSRDPNNPNEYLGMNEKEYVRLKISVENKILMEKIVAFVENSYIGKPYMTLIYRDGEYKYSKFKTKKAILSYYLKKLRKRELWWNGECISVENKRELYYNRTNRNMQ